MINIFRSGGNSRSQRIGCSNRAGVGAILATLLASTCIAMPVMAQDSSASGTASSTEATESGSSVELAPITVTSGGVGDVEAVQTDGYQPLSTSSVTRRNMSLLDVPQSVNVVSEQVLEDQASSSMDEALQNVSGISQINTLGGTQDAIIRRGFGYNRDDSITTNGMKTAQPRSFSVLTERVEVLKGPASTLYGILDPGGLINVVTKKPKDTFQGEVYGSLSSFGGGKTGFDVTGPIEGTNLTARLSGEYQNIDYWRSFGETKRTQIAPSVSWTGEKTKFTATYLHEEYEIPFDRGTIFDPNTGKAVPVGADVRFDEAYNISDGETDLVQLELDQEINSHWNVGVDYSFSRNAYTDNQARVQGYDPDTGDLTRRADATQGSTMYKHALRADVMGDVELAGKRNDVVFGAGYDYSDILRTDMIRCSNVQDFNIYSPSYGNLDTCTNVSAKDSDQTEQLETYSLYAQDSLYLDEQWILIGGLRYQYYDIIAGKGRPFNTNTDSQGHAVVSSAGVVYKVTPSISLYSNVAETFRPQSSIGSFIGDLKPEEGISYEAGVKMELLDGLTANVAVYTSDKKNVTYSEEVDGETVTKAAGLVRARGLEVDVAGSLTENLDVIASYGLTDARVKDDPDYKGNRPVSVARHTGSLFLSYNLGPVLPFAREVRFGGGVRAVSKRAGDAANSFFLPGYGAVDLFASYSLDAVRPVTLQLNVKNALDKTYYTSTIGSNRGVQVGEPLNAMLTMKVAF